VVAQEEARTFSSGSIPSTLSYISTASGNGNSIMNYFFFPDNATTIIYAYTATLSVVRIQ